MIIFFTIIAGLMVGSFLNVWIYRLPRSKSIVAPRSFCPHCEHPIPWYDNIPVLSFLLLGGRCRFCKNRISVRYPIVELFTASVFMLLVSQLGLHITTVIYILLCCGMIVATFIDFEYQVIPDQITYGGMVLGVALSFIFPHLHHTSNRLQSLLNSLAGLLVGGASIYAISAIGTVMFREKLKKIGETSTMGAGDITFLAMIGSFIGHKHVILAFLIAPFFGSIVGIIMKLKHKVDIIPYGPYLSLATLVVILWGNRILRTLFPYY